MFKNWSNLGNVSLFKLCSKSLLGNFFLSNPHIENFWPTLIKQNSTLLKIKNFDFPSMTDCKSLKHKNHVFGEIKKKQNKLKSYYSKKNGLFNLISERVEEIIKCNCDIKHYSPSLKNFLPLFHEYRSSTYCGRNKKYMSEQASTTFINLFSRHTNTVLLVVKKGFWKLISSHQVNSSRLLQLSSTSWKNLPMQLNEREKKHITTTFDISIH